MAEEVLDKVEGTFEGAEEICDLIELPSPPELTGLTSKVTDTFSSVASVTLSEVSIMVSAVLLLPVVRLTVQLVRGTGSCWRTQFLISAMPMTSVSIEISNSSGRQRLCF